MLHQLAAAAAKPFAAVLIAGVVRALYDWQTNGGKWAAALVDGGLTSALMASSLLATNGAVSGVNAAATRATAAKAAPTT